MKKRKTRRGRITDEGLVPDTDPIYERGWTILTGRNLSRNLPRDEPSNTNKNEKKILKGNEKLRAIYANAASALTVRFDDLKTKSKKPP